MRNRAYVGYGAAVGLFVGLMVGMSVSPVVGTVVTALVGAVTAFCTTALGGGLQQAFKGASKESHVPTPTAQIYLAGFSVFGAIALLAGVFVRTHNILSPSPKDVRAQWEEAGFGSDEAKELTLRAFEGSATMSLATPSAASVLIAGTSPICNDVRIAILRGEWSRAESLVRSEGGAWREAADGAAGMTDEQHHAALETFVNLHCDKESSQ